jgi:hypothetical protein
MKTLTRNKIELSDELNRTPVSVAKVATKSKLARIKLPIAATFAVNVFNLDTGLSKEIFIVLPENSPENISILISTVNKGSRVFISIDRTRMGNCALPEALIPNWNLTPETAT